MGWSVGGHFFSRDQAVLVGIDLSKDRRGARGLRASLFPLEFFARESRRLRGHPGLEFFQGETPVPILVQLSEPSTRVPPRTAMAGRTSTPSAKARRPKARPLTREAIILAAILEALEGSEAPSEVSLATGFEGSLAFFGRDLAVSVAVEGGHSFLVLGQETSREFFEIQEGIPVGIPAREG